MPDNEPVVTVANHVPGPAQGQWTYQDYAALPEDGRRFEVVDGVLFMAPAPGKQHQKVAGRFFRYLSTCIEDTHLGEVYIAPYDVELTPHNVVQPDIIVLLNANLAKATESRVVGSPDLVIEVASPGTRRYDRQEKQHAYAHAGIREYWIADPVLQTVEILLLEDGQYHSQGVFYGLTQLPSRVIADFPVPAGQFFSPTI